MTTILAQRITAARNAMYPPVTQTDVANRMHRTKSAVSLWESGRAEPNAECLVELAKWFQVTTDWLLGLDRPAPIRKPSDEEPPISTVPVLSSSAISRWILDLPVGHLQTLSTYPAGTAAAIQVIGHALFNTTPEGSYVVVSKGHIPTSGDTVLVSLPSVTEPIVRRLVEEGGMTMLVADDSRYPTRTLDDGTQIIGKIVEVVIRKTL